MSEEFALTPQVIDARPNGGNGRPKGASNLDFRYRRTLERLARSEAVPVLQKVIQMALDGDLYAAKLVLDRVYPRPKGSPILVDLPATGTPEEIRQAMHALLKRITDGEIAPDDASHVMEALKATLVAHSIPAYGGAVTATDVTQSSARDQLADRLQKILQARSEAREIAASPEAGEPA